MFNHFNIFVSIVKSNSYIAVFLFFIFIAKFLAVDARGLNAVFHSEKISFVNHDCKKKTLTIKNDRTTSIDSQIPSDVKVLTIASQCHSIFLFQTFNWNSGKAQISIRNYSFNLPTSKNSFFDSLRRPPRFI